MSLLLLLLLLCLNTGDMLVYGVELIPLLLQTLEKSTLQPVTQVQQVMEAGAVVNLVAKLLTTDYSIPGMSDSNYSNGGGNSCSSS